MEHRWLLMSILAPFLSSAALPVQADGVYWYLVELGVFPLDLDGTSSESEDESKTTADASAEPAR